ncbi:hypothetical protein SB444474_3836 [Shigella boydii 4444-74]|uniref:Uncharacterized protein n=2 Tax=Shigella TaxID=620 RepID=A0A6N3QHC1_SHIFL|nr:hypothetical protein SGF_03745 [Shigella flexneri CDC 796-83]EIQ33505.1 hypothetical protein SB444474_3836 [Shigella boydii 4444-74]
MTEYKAHDCSKRPDQTRSQPGAWSGQIAQHGKVPEEDLQQRGNITEDLNINCG